MSAATASPRLRKAQRVLGSTLVLRNAVVTDAAFIHGLRTDEQRARFLSPVSAAVQAQARWLRDYAADDQQAYFIVLAAATEEPLGTVRLYGACGDAFSWGSWLLRAGLPMRCAPESALMVYHYALGLGFRQAYFEVRRGNTSVWRFHESFGAIRVGSTDQNFLYQLSAPALQRGVNKYRRFLPHGIRVVQ